MEWLKYLLEVSACITLFFGFYFLVLRRLTFFRFNRFYLLGTLVLSFIIPAMHINLERESKIVPIDVMADRSEVAFNKAEPLTTNQPTNTPYEHQVESTVNWSALLLNVYGLIVLTMIAIQFNNLFKLFKFTGSYVKNESGLKLINKAIGFTNCSFFNYVFIDQENLNDDELKVLIAHEQVHAQELHSADKLLLIMIKAALWFNPIVYLYDRALEQVNEYIADEITSGKAGKHAYANLILQLAITKNEMPLVLNFVKNPIKERIEMLFNPKSKSMKKLVYLFALPAVIVLFWLFAVEVVYAETTVDRRSEKKVSTPQFKDSRDFESRSLHQKETGTVLVKKDSVVRIAVDEPKILSFKKMTGDVQHQISYMEGAEIKVNGGFLKAELVEYDRLNQIIIAKKASFEKDGKVETGDQITFALNSNNYSVSHLQVREIMNVIDADAQLKYQADSTRFDRNKSIIYLSHNARVSIGQTTITGSKIIYNSLNRILTAEQAEFSSTAAKIVKADSVFYDLKTGKVKLFGVDLDR